MSERRREREERRENGVGFGNGSDRWTWRQLLREGDLVCYETVLREMQMVDRTLRFEDGMREGRYIDGQATFTDNDSIDV